MKRLLLFLFFLSLQPVTIGETSSISLKEGQMIRRVFLDVKGVPPTPSELTWYLSYNRNGYEKAVSTILPKDLNTPLSELIKKFLLSPEYKNHIQTLLSPEEQLSIIRYQGGNLLASAEEADKKIISISISNKENGYEPLDYMAELLMARSTTASEETFLTKIIKKYPSEEEGYYAVLQVMKTFKDFTHK